MPWTGWLLNTKHWYSHSIMCFPIHTCTGFFFTFKSSHCCKSLDRLFWAELLFAAEELTLLFSNATLWRCCVMIHARYTNPPLHISDTQQVGKQPRQYFKCTVFSPYLNHHMYPYSYGKKLLGSSQQYFKSLNPQQKSAVVSLSALGQVKPSTSTFSLL